MIDAREQNEDLELPDAWTDLRAKVLRNVKEARVWSLEFGVWTLSASDGQSVFCEKTSLGHLRSVRRYAQWCLKWALEREGLTFHTPTSTLGRL